MQRASIIGCASVHLEALPHSNSLQAEKAKEKEEHSELKEKLDEEYREIAELLKGSAASATAEKQAPKKSEVCVLLYVVVPPLLTVLRLTEG